MKQISHPNRQSLRLKDYDYSQPGGYFVTICTLGKKCIFGEIISGRLSPNEFGRIVQESWLWLERKYPYVELDEWILMPNHLHGIILLHEDLTANNPR